VRSFRQFSAHITKCHACHGICTLSALDAALTMRFAKNEPHDTSKVVRLPREMVMEVAKVLRLPRKLQRIFWKRRKSIAPATQNDFSTRYNTRLNVTKCHACHAKRSNAMLETCKSDHWCRTCHRHGHTGLAWTVADGCEQLRDVERTHPQPPDPQSETGTLATHSGKTIKWELRDLNVHIN